MSFIKLITEVVPKKTHVLLTNSRTFLGGEIFRQLSSYQNILTVDTPDPADSLPQIDSLSVVIHLAGFGSPSLAETLTHTSALHQLLNLSLAHQAKFILVVPNNRQHLYHTAVTLVTQFAKNFKLSYQIIEVDKSSPLSDTAATILKKFIYHHQPPKPVPPRPAATTRSKAPSPQPFLFFLARLLKFCILALLASWSLFLVTLLLSLGFFYCSSRTLSTTKLSTSLFCAQASLYSARLSIPLSHLSPGSTQFLILIGLPAEPSLNLLTSHHRALSSLSSLSATAFQIYQSIFATSSPTSTNLASLRPVLSQSTEDLAQLQSDLRSFYLSSTRYQSIVTSLATRVKSIHSFISKAQSIIPPLNDLLVTQDKFTIVILIQDHHELQATGGRLDSLLILGFERGRLASVQVMSVTAADSQLAGLADSPSDFRLATGLSTWQLRHANWDPDFATTADRISWFLGKELNLTPDLLLGVNTSIFPGLLQATGSLTPDNLSTTFSPSNYSAQYLAYLGSHTQDPSPLPALVQVATARTLQLSPSDFSRLLFTLASALESGQLALAPLTFSLPIASVDWGGGVALPPCATAPYCISDYLLPVRSNLTSRKIDSRLATSANLVVDFQADSFVRHYSYLMHLSQPSDQPADAYTGYLRFFYPPASTLTSLSVEAKPLGPTSYRSLAQHGLASVGLNFSVVSGQDTAVALATSQPLPASGKFHYQLIIPAQPGVLSHSTNITINYPPTWYVSSYQTPSVAAPGRLEYNTPSQGQFKLNLDFTPT